MRLATGILGLVLALQTQTCATITQPVPIRPGLYLTRITPSPIYASIYRAVERCSGGHGDYSKVEWLTVPAPWLSGQHQTLGSWEALDGGRSRIILNAKQLSSIGLIAHESLHDILWRSGWEGPPYGAESTWDDSVQVRHPRPPFGKCAPTYLDLPAAP